MDNQLECFHCKLPMELQKTNFHYMGMSFSTELPRCPVCGLVHIPQELAEGKMAEVEMELEEK